MFLTPLDVSSTITGLDDNNHRFGPLGKGSLPSLAVDVSAFPKIHCPQTVSSFKSEIVLPARLKVVVTRGSSIQVPADAGEVS